MRLFFPAEVTAAYVAFQGLLTTNGISKTEFMGSMIVVAVMLAVINAAIYWRFYEVRNWLAHLAIAIGFMIWVANIDIARFKDLYFIGDRIEIAAPAALIFYTLLTSFFEMPKRKSDVA
jgi:hypothetical protein